MPTFPHNPPGPPQPLDEALATGGVSELAAGPIRVRRADGAPLNEYDLRRLLDALRRILEAES